MADYTFTHEKIGNFPVETVVQEFCIEAYFSPLNKRTGELLYALMQKENSNEKYAFIENITVQKNFRSRGIGSTMLALLESELTAQNVHTIRAKFAPEDELLGFNFYERNGYKFFECEDGTMLYKLLSKEHTKSPFTKQNLDKEK